MTKTKTTLLLYVLMYFLSFNGRSQLWFDLGINSGLGTSFITQKEFYQVNQVNYLPQLNTTFSGKLGVNFSENHSLVIDIGVNNRNFSIDQNEIPSMGINETFRMNFGMSGFRFLPLYRYTNEGSFIELGPEFGKVSTQYLSDFNPLTNNKIFEDYIRGVLGIGGYFIGNERVTLVIGFRMMYDFTELRGEIAKENSFPFQNYPEIINQNPLNALEFQVNFELNISLGFLSRTNCGRRTLMFSW